MLKKSTRNKTNDPTKIRLGPQVKTTRPDPKPSSRLKSTFKVDSQVYIQVASRTRAARVLVLKGAILFQGGRFIFRPPADLYRYRFAPGESVSIQIRRGGRFLGRRIYIAAPARRGHSSNKYCVRVYGSILMRFSALFQNGLFFHVHYSSHFCCQVAPQFSRNCGQKIAKSPKIGGKVCAHHFV